MIHARMVANGAKLFLPFDEVVAWLEASLLDPSEGEEPPTVGRWRQQKGPDEPQWLRRRESMSTSYGEMPCPRRFLELVLCEG